HTSRAPSSALPSVLLQRDRAPPDLPSFPTRRSSDLTGPPVPGSQIERLLQPFHRLAPGRTGQPDGHGLGLSIVQAIAAAHDATLTASPRPGGGLAVEVTFPAPAAPSGSSSHSRVPATSAATAPRPGPARGESTYFPPRTGATPP